MSVNSRIKSALSPIPYPVEANVYGGDADTYLTFNVNPLPTDYGDDAPQHAINLVQIHLVCPHTLNSVSLRKQIKRLIQGGGFTYPTEVDASEDERQHIVFECQDAEGIYGND